MKPPLAFRDRPVEILLTEDNPDDVLLMREAFKHIGLAVNLHHVEDGKQCLAFLRKEGAFADQSRPDLLLLDLKLPVMDGRQVLSELISDTRIRALPVVILTTSATEQDIEEMYELRCSGYIVKPLELDTFERAIRLMCEYWFDLVALPSKRE